MRVLVPATLATLARAAATGWLDPGDGTAFAVTPAAWEMHSDGDTEELELLAAEAAAAASLRLLAAAAGPVPARRVVLSVDVPDAEVTIPTGLDESDDADGADAEGADGEGAAGEGADAPDPALVRLSGSVPMESVASVHLDPASRAPIVTAALPVAAEPALELGALPEGPSWQARDELEASPLLWYDRSEIDALVQEVPAP